MKKILFLITALLCIGDSAILAQPTYSIVNTYHIAGDGSWDILTMDPAAGKLYISHSTVVNVLDVHTGITVGTIPATNGVHDIAIAGDFKKGYTSNGKDTSVTVFNTETLATIKNIKVTGVGPDAMLYDPFSHRVFVFNGHSSNATVIDARKDVVIGTIALAGKPELAVSDERGRIFVNIENKNQVAEIDPAKMKVRRYFNLATGEEPSGLAIDKKHHRLFSTCSNNKMIVLNSLTGAVVATLPIGSRVDGAAFDPALGRAYSSNGDGTITVIEEKNDSTFDVLETIQTRVGAKNITIDETTHHLYLPTAEFGPAPEPTADRPHPRPSVKPNTFVILDVAPVK
ncbi:MAG TPA: YncE family protein [Candidatus Kapabacteria bacterium]|nr:YncE family protein [Candidatus Kapabacteria bacterium]